MIALVAPLALPFAITLLLVRRFAPKLSASSWEFAFHAALALGLGLGLSSCVYFSWLLLAGISSPVYLAVETLLALAVILGLLFANPRRASIRPLPQKSAAACEGRGAAAWLVVPFCAACICAGVGFVFLTLRSPQGYDDALDIWNLHARFLYLSGNRWYEPFLSARNEGTLFSGHPDYPLLVPCSIARLWSCAGGMLPSATGLIAFCFTASTVALCSAVIAVLRGPKQGLLAGIALVGTVFFVTHGASQYADVPLAYFVAASCALLLLYYESGSSSHGLLCLAGASAGLAAWTKNEGLLLVVAIILAHGMVAARQFGWQSYRRQVFSFLVGLSPVLLLLAYHKATLVPANDLAAGQGLEATLGRLTDLSRYRQVSIAMLREYFQLGKPLAVLLPMYVLLVGRGTKRPASAGVAICQYMLAAMLAGYFLVYLTTPLDLQWHLGCSLRRLLLHLWPGTIITLFAMVATPEEAVHHEGCRQAPHFEPERTRKPLCPIS